MTHTRDILIYEDYIFNNGALHRTLRDLVGKDKIDYIDADDIIAGTLDPNRHTLFMPGGADLFLCEKLNGEGNARIREFVEQGGRYIGICSGSYYACAEIDFGSNWPNEDTIKGPRELAFYPGKATGPIDQYCDKSKPFPDGYDSQICKIHYDDGTFISDLKLHYIGGPCFSECEENNEDIKILGRFMDLPNTPPAIIECKIGKGLAFLSSPHIEDTKEIMQKVAYHRNNSYNRRKNIAKQLAGNKEQLNKLWARLIERYLQN